MSRVATRFAAPGESFFAACQARTEESKRFVESIKNLPLAEQFKLLNAKLEAVEKWRLEAVASWRVGK